jgi:hypothetical protein
MQNMTASELVEHYNTHAMKRKLSPSFDDYDSPSDPKSAAHRHHPSSPSHTVASSHTMSPHSSAPQTPSTFVTVPASGKRRSITAGYTDAGPARPPYPRRYTPNPDATAKEVEDSIYMALQPLFAADPGFVDFMMRKSFPEPHSLSVVLKQYRFVQRKVDEWDGQSAPFKSATHHVVNKVCTRCA